MAHMIYLIWVLVIFISSVHFDFFEFFGKNVKFVFLESVMVYYSIWVFFFKLWAFNF